MKASLSKSTVLRLGFGGMIVLLIISAFEAYRIQESASRQTAEIYYRYVRKGDLLSRIRRLLFLGSIQARDFLLSNQPDRAEVFRTQIRGLEAQADATLQELRQVAIHKDSVAKLETNVHEFWSILQTTLKWTDDMRSELAYDFVQSEVTPRRAAAGQLLGELASLNEIVLKNSEAEFAATRRHTMLRLFAILGLCIVLGVGVARFSVSYAERLEKESIARFEEVEQAKKDLQQLSARLLEIQENERKRLSRELHDEIGQTLTALRIEISRAQAAWKTGLPETEERLQEAHLLAEKTVKTVRDISVLLRPSLLDDLGLGPALQWQAEDFSRRSGIRCSFSEEGIRDDLNDEHKTCVYRVVQEALNNCEKHAGATYVRLAISQTGQNLTVQMEDNGRGFQIDKSGTPAGSKGLGLLGMRERVSALGGLLKLESAKDQGTRLFVSLPLTQGGNQS